MKVATLFLLLAVYYADCRKVYKPIDKNANLDFINMESGMGGKPIAVQPMKPNIPVASVPTTKPSMPAAKPATPSPTAAPIVKPVVQPPQKPTPQNSNQIKPVPVNPTPAVNPITTPGPGSVKSLINFYDSQGKASPIRPYSYSQAVKQG